MKLRNKKTGEIGDLMGTLTSCPHVGIGIDFHDGNPKAFYYNSLAELNADWEDYTEPEPEKTELLDELEESAKRADARADRAFEIIVELKSNIKELGERLKTVEEITERLLREDNEQIIGNVKQYDGMPRHTVFDRMKQDLRDWIEKNEVETIKTYFHTEPDGRRGVRFVDKTHAGDNALIIIGWPTFGLVDGDTFTPDELLITGEAGKE